MKAVPPGYPGYNSFCSTTTSAISRAQERADRSTMTMIDSPGDNRSAVSPDGCSLAFRSSRKVNIPGRLGCALMSHCARIISNHEPEWSTVKSFPQRCGITFRSKFLLLFIKRDLSTDRCGYRVRRSLLSFFGRRSRAVTKQSKSRNNQMS